METHYIKHNLHLSHLEADRCQIIPLLPKCFMLNSYIVSTLHKLSLETIGFNSITANDIIDKQLLLNSRTQTQFHSFFKKLFHFVHVPFDNILIDMENHSKKQINQTSFLLNTDNSHTIKQSVSLHQPINVPHQINLTLQLNTLFPCLSNTLDSLYISSSNDHLAVITHNKQQDSVISTHLTTYSSLYLYKDTLTITQSQCIRIGIVIGGETISSGMQNIIIGLWHFLKKLYYALYEDTIANNRYDDTMTPLKTQCCLYGFPNGIIGLLREQVILLGDSGKNLSIFLNRGGCEILPYRSLRHIISDDETQLDQAIHVIQRFHLDGLVILGDAQDVIPITTLAEKMVSLQCSTRIIFVPYSASGNLIHPAGSLKITLGFDTARRTLIEYTGNLATDSISSKKYYHFIRCGSSLLTLETLLHVRPTLAIITEEAQLNQWSLISIINQICDMIQNRANSLNKNSGIILLSDNLIENLPEMTLLIEQLSTQLSMNSLLSSSIIYDPNHPIPPLGLSEDSCRLFLLLPKNIRFSLLTQKDNHKKPLLPMIHPEVLIGSLVEKELRFRNTFSNVTGFLYRTHNLCHECYCALPTDFDCCLGYSLGHTAGALIIGGYTGYVACLEELDQPVSHWKPTGKPLLSLLTLKQNTNSLESTYRSEIRLHVPTTTIDFNGLAFRVYEKYRLSWQKICLYRCLGPVQYTNGVIKVKRDNLPFILQALYLKQSEFENLIQFPDDEEALQLLENASINDYVQLKNSKSKFTLPLNHHILMPRKNKRQLTLFQLKRLQFQPQLPKRFLSKFTIEYCDVTAQLASRIFLLRAVFPLTHHLRALEIVPVGLRLRQYNELTTNDSELETNISTELKQYRNGIHLSDSVEGSNGKTSGKILPRSRSNVSLCGFIGSSSIVRLALDDFSNSINTEQNSERQHSVSFNVNPNTRQEAYTTVSSFDLHPNTNESVIGIGNAATIYCQKPISTQAPNYSIIQDPLEEKSIEKTDNASNLSQAYLQFQTLKWSHIPYIMNSVTCSDTAYGSSSETASQPCIPLDSVVCLKPLDLSSSPCMSFETPHPQSLCKLISQNKNDLCFTYDGECVLPDATNRCMKIAMCFLGQPAPGALNIIWGIKTYLDTLHPPGICYGAVNGLEGLVEQNIIRISDSLLDLYKNQGGIELLSRTSEHCRSERDLEACLLTCQTLGAQGLIVAGGFATISTAALLAEHFLQHHSTTAVVAIPMSIDSGLPLIEVTLGHDTTVHVFNSIIGSIMAESRSSKTWYFLRISGRNLSHLCVECALETHPTLIFISEEVEKTKMSLAEITNFISDVVEARAEKALMYGVVLLSDSLLDHVPEMRMLFNEINAVSQATGIASLPQTNKPDVNAAEEHDCSETNYRQITKTEEGLYILQSFLTPWASALFASLPEKIQWQFAFSKDHTAKVDLANIDTEVLLKTLVENELSRRKALGSFRQKGATFNCKTHFLAYQGRSASPTTFDCEFGYALGYCASTLVDGGKTGYLATLSNLHLHVNDWVPEAIPLTSLIDVMSVSSAAGTSKDPAVADLRFSLHVPALRCSLESATYRLIQAQRLQWLFADCFSNPGPVQFGKITECSLHNEEFHTKFTEANLSATKPKWIDSNDNKVLRLHSLRISPGDNPLNPTTQLKQISRLCAQIKVLCGKHAFSYVTSAARASLENLLHILQTLTSSKASFLEDFKLAAHQKNLQGVVDSRNKHNSLISAQPVTSLTLGPELEQESNNTFYNNSAAFTKNSVRRENNGSKKEQRGRTRSCSGAYVVEGSRRIYYV